MSNEIDYISKNSEIKDYNFSLKKWSAITMVSPEKIKLKLTSFHLDGRTIKRMKFVGHSYFHTRNWIESHAYNVLNNLDEDERKRQSSYVNIPLNLLYGRSAIIDEPLLIEFEDGDVFEIITPQISKFEFSMNCIPWWIDSKINAQNIDADVFFAPCIGKIIKSVEVKTYITQIDPLYNDFFDESHSSRELVSSINLYFDNNTGIRIGGYIDYCKIDYINTEEQILPISFQELKPSLFNWEDLHIDEVSGFEPKGSTFFFGKIGVNHVEEPFITLVPDENKSQLHISVTDFLIFDWAITLLTGRIFDEYESYDFNFKRWNFILDEAEKILDFQKFDELFDYLTSFNIEYKSGENILLSSLNSNGADFWKQKEKYKTQLIDMRNWTNKVLLDNKSMKIYGF